MANAHPPLPPAPNTSFWPFLALLFNTRVLTSKSVTAATHSLWVVRAQTFPIQGWILNEHQPAGNEQARPAALTSLTLVGIPAIMLTRATGTQHPI